MSSLSPLSQVIPNFGATTLEGDYDMGSFEPGRPLKGNSKRQFVRFFNLTTSEVYTIEAKINEKTGNSVPIKTGVRDVTREMVEVVTPGDTNLVCTHATDWHRRTFWKQYRAFRDGKTAPMGLPVDEAKFISTHIATELKYLGCHTVEQLADASDVLCGNVANGFELREFARSFCKAQASNKTSPQVVLLSKELESARAEIAAMQEQMKSLIVDKNGAPMESVKRSPKKPKSDEKVITE